MKEEWTGTSLWKKCPNYRLESFMSPSFFSNSGRLVWVFVEVENVHSILFLMDFLYFCRDFCRFRGWFGFLDIIQYTDYRVVCFCLMSS